mgnify:CR=1 FL=1
MSVAMAGLVFNDTLMQLASQDVPVGQAVCMRGLVRVPVLAIAAWRAGAFARVRDVLQPAVGLRTVSEMAATGLYLTALSHLPIANATVILQLVPLLSIGIAALLFGEKVRLRRWMAVIVGLAAVVLIIRPGMAGFDGWTLVAVLAAVFITMRDYSSRLLPRGTSSLLVSFVAAVAVSALSLGMTGVGDWVPLTRASVAFCTVAGFVLAVAYFSIVGAMRSGEVGAVAPYRYTIVLWAIIIQIVVFGSAPDLLTLAGAGILVATGLYSFYSERRIVPPRAPTPR